MFIAKTGLKWDAATISNIGIEDLDQESFEIFRREALRSGRMSKEDLDIANAELLEKLDLVVDGKLKRAGALCFYRKPEKVIGGCYVKIGKFEGSELLYQDEVHGFLLILADRVIDLIYLKYLKAAISYYKETRVETYPFARDAVREAVFNALIHRLCKALHNVWDKLFTNVSLSAVTGILQVDMGYIAANPYAWKMTTKLIHEAATVAKAMGLSCDEEAIIESVRETSVNNPEGCTSIRADIRAGRKTEVDTISGAVVRTAAEYHVEVPTHEFVVDMVHALEGKET